MGGIVRAVCMRWWTAVQHLCAVHLVQRATRDFARQAGPTAAAMSYYALLSLFPLLIATVAVLREIREWQPDGYWLFPPSVAGSRSI